MRNLSLVTIAFSSSLALSGCVVPAGGGYAPQPAPQYGGYSQPAPAPYYPQQNTGYPQNYQQQQNAQYGVVVSVRPVVIQGSGQPQAPIGALIGAVAGGVVGNQLGKGRGHVVGAVAGAALGGLAGNAIQQNAAANSGQNALEIVVRLRNGSNVVVTQVADQQFSPGDRVTVYQNADGSSSVSR